MRWVICRGELLHITVVFALHQNSIQTTRPCNVRHTSFLLLLINFHLLTNEWTSRSPSLYYNLQHSFLLVDSFLLSNFNINQVYTYYSKVFDLVNHYNIFNWNCGFIGFGSHSLWVVFTRPKRINELFHTYAHDFFDTISRIVQ